ncbi:MAG: T9SS type A sorting domain-containing protein [Bacteroidales bacterium]|nr:T9SS type A sorting domain-containing protein [Bacteroidales bacterium]MCF8455770.1 T9SS type A sorting domain-containing protein [Bacteroidales bacterium]
MKKIIFILVLLPFFASAQQAYPLVKDGGIWRIVEATQNGPNDPVQYEKFQYYVSGDTSIENNSYKKVYLTNYDSIINIQSYVAAIREDSTKKVYVRVNGYIGNSMPLSDSTDYLLYDFNLTEGDTFTSQGNAILNEWIVDAVDSIDINGEWRKRINLYSYVYTSWIEGIGDLNSLFFPLLYTFEHSFILSCYEDDNIFWTNPYLIQINTDCYTYVIEESINSEKSEMQVFPNPSGDYITFKSEKAFEHEAVIYIFNSLGQIKDMVKLENGLYNINVHLDNYPSGIYFYKIENKLEILENGKFVKE